MQRYKYICRLLILTKWQNVKLWPLKLPSDWEGKGPCAIVPLTLKMAHQSPCRVIRNGPLKISKSLKKAENGPLAKSSSQSLNYLGKTLDEHAEPESPSYIYTGIIHWQDFLSHKPIYSVAVTLYMSLVMTNLWWWCKIIQSFTYNHLCNKTHTKVSGVTLGRDFGIFSHFFLKNLIENVRMWEFSLTKLYRSMYKDESNRANKAEVWKYFKLTVIL